MKRTTCSSFYNGLYAGIPNPATHLDSTIIHHAIAITIIFSQPTDPK
ncbi:MAG: hypothetical protein P5700_25200 [Arthrospira platensis PCC 7345]|nr:hypothetical protein [Limnospira indica]MDT9298254.1 hypothetical protein [Arthrospira platensis PCC 7345]MDT9310904.1 hypothetical protein [Limnospira sp. Paracas R14]